MLVEVRLQAMEYNEAMEPSRREAPMLVPHFPQVPKRSAFYESIYLKANHPSEPMALWIRYTVHKRPEEEPTASLWSTFFDASRSVRATAKSTLPAPHFGSGVFSIGDSWISGAAAKGEVLDHRWDLRFSGSEPELRHLPRDWMYRRSLPRTKLTSPLPSATFDGSLWVGDRGVEVAAWPGMLGHNWGSQHAERWIWLHAIFDEGSWLDVAFGRIRVVGLTSPWIANGSISIDGRRHTLGGLQGIRQTEVEDGLMECRFSLPGEVTVRGTVTRRPEQTVAWEYRDPGGSLHHSLNSSTAGMSLEVSDRTLSTEHGAAYELGVRDPDHGIPIAPFTDG